MARGDDFEYMGYIGDALVTNEMYECPECYAVIHSTKTEKHEAWHKGAVSGPVIEFRWDNDDHFDILVNGSEVAFWDYDLYGRDALEVLEAFGKGIARELGGTFRSEN